MSEQEVQPQKYETLRFDTEAAPPSPLLPLDSPLRVMEAPPMMPDPATGAAIIVLQNAEILETSRNVLFLGITAFCEASGEGMDGVRAVVHSIMNRFAAKRWYSGKTVASTCLVPFQYSCWNDGDRNAVRALETPMVDSVLVGCLEEARKAIVGESSDPTEGATHYYSPSALPDPSKSPSWSLALGAELTVVIGKHRFYKGVK